MCDSNIYYHLAADMLTSGQTQTDQRLTLINLGGFGSESVRYGRDVSVEILTGIILAIREFSLKGKSRNQRMAHRICGRLMNTLNSIMMEGGLVNG
jgi:hypothetical protein